MKEFKIENNDDYVKRAIDNLSTEFFRYQLLPAIGDIIKQKEWTGGDIVSAMLKVLNKGMKTFDENDLIFSLIISYASDLRNFIMLQETFDSMMKPNHDQISTMNTLDQEDKTINYQ